jgi:nucleoside phosphorylase
VFREATGQAAIPTPIGDQIYHNLGMVNDARIFMVQSEMGSVGLGASQQTIQKGIEALSPSAVIMVGIAFGVNPEKQSIGNILISRQLMLYELQRVSTEEGKPRLIPRGDRPHASVWLVNLFRSAHLYWNESEAKVIFGPILSGEKLIDNMDFRQQIVDFVPEAIGGEMEGAGLYVACQDAKVDWILVKAICDWADGHKAQDKNERQQLAARNAAEFVLHMLQQASFKQKDVGKIRSEATPDSVPNLRLKLYKMSRDRGRYDEISLETHRALPQLHPFGLALENLIRSTRAKGIYIRIEFSWRGNNINKAPSFQAPHQPGWKAQIDTLICEQSAVLTFRDPELSCFYGQPIEWDNVRLILPEHMNGYLLVRYNVSSDEPHTQYEGELKIILDNKQS